MDYFAEFSLPICMGGYIHGRYCVLPDIGPIKVCSYRTIRLDVNLLSDLSLCRLVILIEGCPVNTPLRLCISSWHWSLLCDYFFDVVMVATMVLHAFFFAFVQLEGSVQHTITDHRMIFERFVKSKKFFVLLLLVIPADFLAIQFGYLSCFRSATVCYSTINIDCCLIL